MLFPVTEAYEKMRIKQDDEVEKEGVADVEDVIYFKQTSQSKRRGSGRAEGGD